MVAGKRPQELQGRPKNQAEICPPAPVKHPAADLGTLRLLFFSFQGRNQQDTHTVAMEEGGEERVKELTSTLAAVAELCQCSQQEN